MESSPNKPHLILFNPDQWRADVMGHFGNPAARTPNLDRLTETDAVSFRNAFCQNPVCTPSRCSFMTGLYPHTNGHRTMFHMLHEEHERHLFNVLNEAGYHIWWGGKNDLFPGQEGWGRYVAEHFSPSDEQLSRWGRKAEGNHDGEMAWRGEPDGDNYYSFYKGKLDRDNQPYYLDGDWINVLGAVERIQTYDGDGPLCIYLPLSYPHPPYCVEEPYFSAIERGTLPPRVYEPDWSRKPMILGTIHERQRLQGWTEGRWDELRAVYYGMCMRVDAQVGMILDALRARGIYDDTAFFLFSDHGDFTGDYGLVEKTQNTFEDCLTNVPFIIKPPKQTPLQPGVRHSLVELVDLSATIYDLLQIDPGYDSFGQSLLPVLGGTQTAHRDAVFCEGGRRYGEVQCMERESSSSADPNELYYPRVNLQARDDAPYHTRAAMCRTERYKYVQRLYEQDELYDLELDPDELVNRVDDPAYQMVLIEMKDRMLRWHMETSDTVPRQTDLRGFVGKEPLTPEEMAQRANTYEIIPEHLKKK